jgi:hypothetical protein
MMSDATGEVFFSPNGILPFGFSLDSSAAKLKRGSSGDFGLSYTGYELFTSDVNF